LRKQNPVSGDKESALAQFSVHGDKIWPHDAVAIQKNTISPPRDPNCPITGFGRTEAEILMPSVLKPASDFWFPGFDEACRCRA
jgi:hypothetical protein